MTLKDKIIIVTGAASGMGRAATEMLCKEGAVVYAADRNKRLWNRAARRPAHVQV